MNTNEFETAGMFLRPSARLQKYLGRELIGDPSLAVIEFVKNAYDAGADQVVIEFKLSTEPSTLTISDDGIGMDERAFRTNWLSPGFSSKSPEYAGPSTNPNAGGNALKRTMGREPAGEKGLGRLASGRLGDIMHVWTRPSPQEAWLHVVFDWKSFDDMTKFMDQIPIPFDAQPPSEPKFSSGTIVKIENLRQNWVGRVPGRPVPGRRRTRLGRLKQDIELLIRPLGGKGSDFVVNLRSDAFSTPEDVGEVRASEGSRSADYTYDFVVAEDEAGYVVVGREIRRSKEISEEFGLPEYEELETLTVTKRLAQQQGRSESLSCGPFSGTFFYTPPPKARRAREVDAAATGVLLYRDGVLVEPYGLPGDDWVGAEARKASRQGHAAIQPATFSGFVLISRRTNPELEDMSNRLGLLENEASDDFFSHVRAEFAFFDSLVYDEVVRQRWATLAEQATRAAAEAEGLARIRTRALTHSVGQPLAAIAFEALRLELLRKRDDVSEPVRLQLEDVQTRIESHLGRIGKIVRKFADAREPEFQLNSADELVRRAMAEVEDLAKLSGVELLLRTSADHECLVPAELVVDSLAELLTNAIEVDRPEGRTPWIKISVNAVKQEVLVRIEDNGQGFPSGLPEDLQEVASSKGRPAGGLATVENAIRVSNGDIHVESTGHDGTVITVHLPSRLSRAKSKESV